MAIGATYGADFFPGSKPVVINGSCAGIWQQIHDDCTQTAHTTTLRCNPWGITSSAFHWLRVGVGVTRAALRVRVPKSTGSGTVNAITTSPLLGLIGAWPSTPAYWNTDPASYSAGEWSFGRLDVAGPGSVGTAYTLGISATVNYNDSTYWYSQFMGTGLGSTGPTVFDLYGAHAIAVVITTAAVIGATAGTATAPVDALLLN